MSIFKEYLMYVIVLLGFVTLYHMHQERLSFETIAKVNQTKNEQITRFVEDTISLRIANLKTRANEYVQYKVVQDIAKLENAYGDMSKFAKELTVSNSNLIILGTKKNIVFQNIPHNFLDKINLEDVTKEGLHSVIDGHSLYVTYHLPIVYQFGELVGYLVMFRSNDLNYFKEVGLTEIRYQKPGQGDRSKQKNTFKLSDDSVLELNFDSIQKESTLFIQLTFYGILLLIFLLTTILYNLRISVPIRNLTNQIVFGKTPNESSSSFWESFINKSIKKLIEEVANLKDDIEKKKTNLRRLVTELKEDKVLLKRDNNLLKVLTHDIANPIAVIKGTCDMAKLVPETNFAKLYSLIHRIEKSAVTAEQIMTHVRDMIAVQSGKKSINMIRIELADVIADVKFLFEDRLREKNIRLEYINNSQDMKFIADKNTFTNNVFNNIMSNAIKFSYRGSVITVESEVKDGWFHIAIRDQGDGIPDDLIGHLFNPDKKTSRFGTDGEKGTGFGLPVAKTYMDYFEGHIMVESICKKDGQQQSGTTFHLYLKLQSDDDA